MWLFRFNTLGVLLFFYCFSFHLLAQVPQTLSYQGLLTDNNGVPVADGSYAVTIRFYNAATGGTAVATRGPLTVTTFKGLFAITLGTGGTDNAPLPFTLADQEFFVGLTVSPSTTELSPRVQLTAVPYAFIANTVKSVNATVITSGTVPDARLSTHLQDLADGTLTGSKVGSGINAANITTGTLPVERLGDGAITNAKLASGIDATKITTGTLPLANGGTGATTAATARTNLGLGTLATISSVTSSQITDGTISEADLANGAVTNAKLANGIDAGKITTGVLSGVTLNLIGVDASRLAAGTTAQRPASPVEGQIRYNTTEKVMEYYNGTNWYFVTPKTVYLKDIKPNATHGGDFPGGVWVTRVLNSLEGDNSFITLNANQFTLLPGEYEFDATVPGYGGNNGPSLHRAKLRNITASLDVIIGGNANAQPGTNEFSYSRIMGRFVVTSTTAFEVQHRGEVTQNTFGLGMAAAAMGTVEVFSQVKIRKLR